MNIYTKKTKKFILILVLLILFNFGYPKQVKATIDFGGNISSFFFWIEEGVIGLINELFCDKTEGHKYVFDPENEEIHVNLTPENIIKGKFLLFNANIFDELNEDELASYYDGGFDWLSGAKTTLRNTISGWYYSLRNFAIIALLSVLVYVGIRMVTSTISQDKAKYKTMFKDWLVAICLLVVMQYIMIGVLNVTDEITKAIGIDGGGGSQIGHMMSLIYNINEGDDSKGWGGIRYTDLDTNTVYTLSDAFGYELLLLCQAVFMVIFAWKYLKREFTVIFLILLGPISCITYPIDKISDGKAQAFNKWLTEFIYNVLVQPFHLLLYTVLCGSAVELANNNILYGIACLAMIIPAEKFVKEMFGFKDKLGGGPLAAASMGAIGSQLVNKLKSGGSGKSSKNTSNDSADSKDNTQIRTNKPDGSVLTDGKTR